MIKEILKEQITKLNFSQKLLAIKTDISQQHISEVLSGKRRLTVDIANKLEKVFGLPKMSLFLTQNELEELASIKNDQNFKAIANLYRDKMPNYETYDKETLLKIAAQEMRSHNFQNKKNEINNSVKGFYKYKDKPLAYYWIAVLENNYAHLQSQGKFKKSTGPSVIKGVLDLMIDKYDIYKRIELVKRFLDKNGIILINAPFVPDSTINGACFKRNTQRFIFMSDSKKREYSYIFSLIHELMHYYEATVFPCNEKGNRLVAKQIKNYLNKYNKTHDGLEMAMKIYRSNSNAQEKWNALYKATKNERMDFGNLNEFLTKNHKHLNSF